MTTPTTTLNAGDSLTGGAGNDVLSIVVQDNKTGGVSGFFTKEIEDIRVQVADTAGETFDFAGVAGATSVTSLNSAGSLTVTGIQTNAKIVAQGTNAGITAGFANAIVGGTADVGEVEINGSATTANVAINLVGNTSSFETVNIKSTGAASGNTASNFRVSVDDGANNTIKTVNISGDAGARLAVSLDGAAATSSSTVGVVNITNTAGVNVAVAGAGRTFVSVTGGTGNDAIVVTNLDQNSTIAGGDGIDTLVVTSTDALAATAFKNVTGFEKIQLQGALTNPQNLASAGAVTDVILGGALNGGSVSGLPPASTCSFWRAVAPMAPCS